MEGNILYRLSPKKPERITLLIVDDEPDLQAVLTEILNDGSFEILTALNGREALQILLFRPVTAILSDINMPLVGGLELLREVRLSHPTLPFLILSGNASPENLREAVQLGATEFIDKPFDEGQIRQVIWKAIRTGSRVFPLSKD